MAQQAFTALMLQLPPELQTIYEVGNQVTAATLLDAYQAGRISTLTTPLTQHELRTHEAQTMTQDTHNTLCDEAFNCDALLGEMPPAIMDSVMQPEGMEPSQGDENVPEACLRPVTTTAHGHTAEAGSVAVNAQPILKITLGIRKNRPTCLHPGCDNFAARPGKHCKKHGGGKRCFHPDCNTSARPGFDFCSSHGGVKRCSVNGCSKPAGNAKGTVLCSAHGGTKQCSFPLEAGGTCIKTARSGSEFCVAHGGSGKTSVPGRSRKG